MISEKMASDSILDKFGVDITKKAEKGELDPCIGREKEIERMSIIISRRKKNNVVLIGEPGVGKTALVEGFAQAIVNKKVKRNLIDKKVFYLDISSIVAGTKYRGEFEERMKIIIDEIEKREDIILFIDEIHTMVGAGSTSGSLDVSNILKPSLARGTIQCIGSTTLDEYRKYIEKDGALERRFQKLIVDPPSEDESMVILKNLKEKYEDYHSVKYTDRAIEACVRLTNRYITDRSLPDKAIDALDESGSKVHITNIKVPKKITNIEDKIEEVKNKKLETIKKQLFEESAKYRDQERELQASLKEAKEEWEKKSKKDRIVVDVDVITDVVSLMSGVPVTSISENESEKLLNIENSLQKIIVGQDDAIVEIAKSIRRNRSGLKDPNRPIGTFLFLGNSGVGKCHGKGTKILMYDGKIKNVEDIRVGDLLMGDDSTPRTVLSLARGLDHMYKINPLNGGDSFVCNEPHVLSLKKTGTYEIFNIPLNEYLKKKKWIQNTYKLWRTSVEFKTKPVLIDPYFFGLWLGDGNCYNVGITTADQEIVDYIYKIANDWDLSVRVDELENNKSNVYVLTGKIRGEFYDNRLMKAFRSYSLMNDGYKSPKLIPDDYLYNNDLIRKKLLAGIIDSDGWQFHNCYEISTKSKPLSEQIVFLCRSLGYRTNSKIKIIKEKEYYVINISGDLSDLDVLLNRKKSTPRKQIKNFSLTGFDVEYLGIDEYYGFEIDGNHLYLLGDFTVTHNTHLAKMLAKYMFDSEENLIRFDMSEYMEKHSVSRLIGAPPGYVGYDEGGQLTEKVRRKPYSIVLFDEIEKAHPDVYNIFLQMFDDGVLTDNNGNKVDFKNTIIIMTSNIGTRKLKDFGTGIGFATPSIEQNKSEIQKSIIDGSLKKTFSPELINRIDNVVIFNSLNKEEIVKILDIELDKLFKRAKENGFTINLTDDFKKFVIEDGYDENYGARHLKRSIQKNIEDPIAEEIIRNPHIDIITMNYIDGQTKIETILKN